MTPQDTPRTQFEQRMRLRRAATCVSAARVALEAGRVLEAQERLEEACRLDPDGLEARILLEQLKSVEPEDLFEPLLPDEDHVAQGARRWSHWAAVVIAVVALAVLAWWRTPAPDDTRVTPIRQPERTRPRVEAPAAVDARPTMQPSPSAAPASVPGADSLPENRSAPSANAANEGLLARAAEPRVDDAATGPGERPRGTTGRLPAPAPAARPTDRRPSAPASDSVAERAGSPSPPAAQPPAGAEPSRSLPSLTEALPTVTAAAPVEGLARSRPAAEEPAPAPPPPAAAGDAAPASLRDPAADEEAIGEVLGQYADAYNRLDATAARRVWPTVDERALARAFAGLESQGVTFERCDLEVEGTDATAACRGRARYVPKVGSRDPISESRQWSFRLRRAGSGWQIVQAEAR